MTVPTSPSWYDVLGVDADASPDEIRTAWRDSIADLDPGDRRFRLLNQAAEVLLDQTSKSAYDADLDPTDEGTEASPGSAARDRDAGDPGDPSATRTRRGWLRSRGDRTDPTPEPTPAAVTPAVVTPAAETAAETAPRRGPSSWLLAPVALVTALLIAAAAYLVTQPSDSGIANSTDDAQSAAERAATTILAYDYRRLPADQKAADALMTPAYADKYDALFAQIQANAADLKPVVTATVLASGIVHSGADKVVVLVFVNRPTTRADGAEKVFHDQVRLTMVRSGDDWLVDNLQTSATG